MKDARAPLAREAPRRSAGMRAVTPVALPRTEQRAFRTQPPRRMLRPLLLPVLMVGVAGVSALAVVGGARLLSRADALPLRTMAVRGAEANLADEVRAYAGITDGTPLFAIDLDVVAGRVLEHPFVRAVEVRRVPPDALEIEVQPRHAVALVDVGGLYLADDAGALFKRARVGDGLDLPLITGLNPALLATGSTDPLAAARILAAVELLRAHVQAGTPGGPISEIHHTDDGEVSLVFADGLRAHLGAAPFADKLVRLAAIVERLTGAGQHASSIRLDDERRPERAAVRLRRGAETLPVGG